MNDISQLKKDIEFKFGRQITTPSVFDSLYLEIKKDTGKEISPSTLKRIWGYVKYPHHPRHEILSILSQYLGYKDWNDYISINIQSEVSDISDFLTKNIIESKNLNEGEIVQIAWAPNRRAELLYLGDSRYKVIEAINSKIKKGDLFTCSIIAKGEPMMCSSIYRDGKLIAECYIAARYRGLNQVMIKHKS